VEILFVTENYHNNVFFKDLYLYIHINRGKILVLPFLKGIISFSAPIVYYNAMSLYIID
jgi:hypothetical protein